MLDKHNIYVYGTLRPSSGETLLVPGTMYDLGWYPGVILPGPKEADSGSYREGDKIVAQKIVVDDQRLQELDRYEGYDPENPSGSLYIRRPILDGWIYEYNLPTGNRVRIDSGDWFEYKAMRKAG